MAKTFKRTQRKLTDEQKATRAMICDNKSELIESKEYFNVGVDSTVVRARVVGAGNKAVKFSFNLGGLSTVEKSTPCEFFLDYPELDDNLVIELEEFLGQADGEDEEIADENITLFNVQQQLPAK
jgi:hypothetical protein